MVTIGLHSESRLCHDFLIVWMCDNTKTSFRYNFFTPYANRIVTAFPFLTNLSLRSLAVCKQTDDDLAMMLSKLPHIKFLELSFTQYKQDTAGFKNFAKVLSTLKSLHTFEFLVDLHSDIWGLEALDHMVEMDKVFDSLQQLPKLSKLTIGGFVITSPEVSTSLCGLLSLDQLSYIYFSDTYPSRDTFEAIRGCQRIKTFKFIQRNEIPDIGLESIFSHSSQSADFQPEYIEIDANVAAHRSNIPPMKFDRLRHLSLCLDYHDEDIPTPFIGHVLQGLQNSPFFTNFLKASKSLQSLKLQLSPHPREQLNKDESQPKEIYGILTMASQSIMNLYFTYPDIDSHIDEICAAFLANTMPMLRVIQIYSDSTDLMFRFWEQCVLRRDTCIKEILFVGASFVRIAPQKWKFCTDPLYFQELLKKCLKLWEDGNSDILYVQLRDGNRELAETEIWAYDNLELGLVCGEWAVWCKDFFGG
ncbi:hypothetical protein HK098_006421 [Nowakowskiella sp. JEL0407]|nr:hypothetical protein HK098_006421 [Nowakowskiella sp. JEL0407]